VQHVRATAQGAVNGTILPPRPHPVRRAQGDLGIPRAVMKA
jgi:hypothetical protein